MLFIEVRQMKHVAGLLGKMLDKMLPSFDQRLTGTHTDTLTLTHTNWVENIRLAN